MSPGSKEALGYASAFNDREFAKLARYMRTQLAGNYPYILEATTLIAHHHLNEEERLQLPRSIRAVGLVEEGKGKSKRLVGIKLENATPARLGRMLKPDGSIVFVEFLTNKIVADATEKDYVESRGLLADFRIGGEIGEKAQKRTAEEKRREAEKEARKAQKKEEGTEEILVETAELG